MVKIMISRYLIRAFRHILCEERKKHGLTQFQLARKSGLTRQSISLFESGRRAPTFFSLFSIARGFDMPVPKFVSLLVNKAEYYERHKMVPLAADSKRARWRV
jgi:transcriptional regulator with XRE-family HTH domain